MFTSMAVVLSIVCLLWGVASFALARSALTYIPSTLFRHHKNSLPDLPRKNYIGVYRVDDFLGVGRRFDGIGAISGGGATSKLLVNYEEPYRSDILDYLFKPGIGASLQILKVEIGGDSQSSDGSEASHMHTASDENYERGYEWWLMKEAKKRNPDIKLYGLPWVFPGWVGGGVFNPFFNLNNTVKYVVNWIRGAQRYHNLTIDYIGVWNERKCNKTYVKLLRSTLDALGYSQTQIVGPDAYGWNILDQLYADPDYVAALGIIGVHYPGVFSPATALTFDKPLWASEDYSSYDTLSGGACWARVLNEGPVNGFFTAFIAWNLVASYYDGLPYTRDSLMTANEPWSGHYEVSSPIWITAHHTQLYSVGWHYLLHSHGVGNLSGNGTYISLTNNDRSQLTIVIETVAPSNDQCAYSMPFFSVADEQIAEFKLDGSFAGIQQFNVWYSFLDFDSNATVLFSRQQNIAVTNGQFSIKLKKNEVYTLSTMDVGIKGDHVVPPKTKPFPLPYHETFEDMPLGIEPYNLAQQAGVLEVTDSSDVLHGNVATQVITDLPVDTCWTRMMRPVIVFGDYTWSNVSAQIDVMLESPPRGATGAYLAARTSSGGCDSVLANGVYLWVDVLNQTATLTANHSRTAVYTVVPVTGLKFGQWFTMRLDVQGLRVRASLNNDVIIDLTLAKLSSRSGFVAFGCEQFAIAHFDDVRVMQADATPRPACRHCNVTDNDGKVPRGRTHRGYYQKGASTNERNFFQINIE